ncbi:MAG: Histidinol-phosphate aminotransferase [bacterium]|nr:Histidinol-phosphate aminotransferase [bacterium]
MYLPIDHATEVPLYQQVVDGVKALVDDGRLPANTRVPSSRQLAEELDLSRKTVLTAYQILIADHYLETRPQAGTFVVDRSALKEVQTGTPATPPPVVDSSLFDWSPFAVPNTFFALPRQRVATDHALDVINLISATPDPHLFPFDRIKQIAQTMVWNPKDYFFTYGHAQGYQPLVEHLEQRMALEGVAMAPGQNDIVLVTGFQKGLHLLIDLLAQPGDVFAVEQPTYASILNLLMARRLDYVGIPMDREGMRLDRLEAALKQQQIRAIITIPTCHNPTGTTMSLERREQLLALAGQYQVPVIEDDYALDLRFDGPRLPSLKALDQSGLVLHIGSFSKVFLPGLRLGWITAPSPAALELVRLKRAVDQSDSYFLQAFQHEFIKRGYYDQHVRLVTRTYQSRRDALIEGLAHYLPPGIGFSRPQGGLSLWVDLPAPWQSLPVYHLAREEGVEIGVAPFFMPGKSDTSGFRLAYSLHSEASLKEAARRLGQALTRLSDDPTLYEHYAATWPHL